MLRFPLDICEDSELVCEPEVKLSLYLMVVNVEVVFRTVSFVLFCFVLRRGRRPKTKFWAL